ncbi:MAG: pyruvate, phosphate dikinase [Elusimicrobia bacterium]|nr:pyruvate, phosphate dikinase [Elusimicrobiota bacterium]
MAKSIYSFGETSDVRAVSRLDRDAARALLGGKGAGLFEMSRIGLPVPPGFTVTTDVCRARCARKAESGLTREFLSAVRKLEKSTGRSLGDAKNPLLVSVRSGSKFSMPGMMDTVLNLGLNDKTVRGLEAQTGNPRFAWDCYRRFIAMFGNVVKGIGKDEFEAALRRVKSAFGAEEDSDLSTQALRKLVAIFQVLYEERAGSPFPQDPGGQLRLAVSAVFESWNNPRAIAYRRLNRIPDDLGTACTVQAMVFGNMGADCATGVGFTRDPGTGERAFYGEFLVNAQGEDVVAGVRTPRPLAELSSEMPKTYERLLEISGKLEKHYGDVQDMEFTIEKGRLFMLQTRTGKRSAMAALRIAVDMVEEGLITPVQAVMRLTPEQLDELLRPVFEERASASAKALAKGLPAGPGAATGRVCFSADRAVVEAKTGPVILVRPETNPDDIHGMAAAEGILTATGGMTSHAAVVGRGMGKVCVVGCAALEMDESAGTMKFGGETLKEGDWLSLDGFKGRVLEGRVQTQPSEILDVLLGRRPAASSELYRRYEILMTWADAARSLEVRANADTPEDAKVATALGAAGIGLCRTEHMFFGEDRIPKVLAMILADSEAERREAVSALYPLQKADFKAIFKTMRGLPVTVRTIDPPLHEFLPRTPEDAARAAASHGLDAGKLWAKTLELKESNPMLGHRGCRLGITYPEITDMQARAVLSAACELSLEGVSSAPEIMIPLVGHVTELRHQKKRILAVAERVFQEYGRSIRYQVGTMIEVPRAALTAGEIAAEAEFFSFGTNDLTQMTLGYSRDDYGRYIAAYMEMKILDSDPFRTLDGAGVGRLVRLAVEEGRRTRPGMKIGICGEHGGDPASIRFFHEAGLGYVSCSPYRVPVARLAAAQAAIASKALGSFPPASGGALPSAPASKIR